MSSVETRLSDQQKENLEEARSYGAFHSRTELILWFADNAVRIVKEAVEREEDPYQVKPFRLGL